MPTLESPPLSSLQVFPLVHAQAKSLPLSTHLVALVPSRKSCCFLPSLRSTPLTSPSWSPKNPCKEDSYFKLSNLWRYSHIIWFFPFCSTWVRLKEKEPRYPFNPHWSVQSNIASPRVRGVAKKEPTRASRSGGLHQHVSNPIKLLIKSKLPNILLSKFLKIKG